MSYPYRCVRDLFDPRQKNIAARSSFALGDVPVNYGEDSPAIHRLTGDSPGRNRPLGSAPAELAKTLFTASVRPIADI